MRNVYTLDSLALVGVARAIVVPERAFAHRARLSARLAAEAAPLYENHAAVAQLEDCFARACRCEL